MNIGLKIKKIFTWGFNAFAGRMQRIVHHPRRIASPLADRLLADALRIAELPSPGPDEEKRMAFVQERLSALGFEGIPLPGGLLLRLVPEQTEKPPIVLFSSLRSYRWHPTESLARLDRENAQGAGLAGGLGPAALLSLAEGFAGGRLRLSRETLLLFTAASLCDPESRFHDFLDAFGRKPAAALGVQGFSLGLIVHPRGYCRQRITFNPKEKSGGCPAAETLIVVSGNLLEAARKREEIYFRIRRIEAAAPQSGSAEAVLETEIESSEEDLLSSFIDFIKTEAEGKAVEAGINAQVETLSRIPPGDSTLNKILFDLLRNTMKKHRIKIREKDGMDAAGLFSAEGIPALSLGLSLGKAEANRDTVHIASVEKGRRLLESLVAALEEGDL
jgi:hypothetical protein